MLRALFLDARSESTENAKPFGGVIRVEVCGSDGSYAEGFLVQKIDKSDEELVRVVLFPCDESGDFVLDRAHNCFGPDCGERARPKVCEYVAEAF